MSFIVRVFGNRPTADSDAITCHSVDNDHAVVGKGAALDHAVGKEAALVCAGLRFEERRNRCLSEYRLLER